MLRTLLGVLLALGGGLLALYCGVGSLFLFGATEPLAHRYALIFVLLAIVGIGMVGLAVWMLAGSTTRPSHPASPSSGP